MGWAEKLASGKYRGLYRDAAGRRRSAGTFPHKSAAMRAAAAAETKARRRLHDDLDAHKRLWGDWVDEWLDARVVEPSTAKTDEGRIRNHLRPVWEAVPLGAIRRIDVKTWVASLLRGGMSPSTAQRCIHLFSASLVAAVDAEILDANPAARIKIAGGGKGVERFLTHAEHEAVLEEMATDDERLVAEFLAYTGVRWGELAGMHTNAVDLKRRRVHVTETFDEKTGDVKGYPKGQDDRWVPLTDSLMEQLAPRLARRGNCGIPHRVGICRHPLLFESERGGPLRNSNFANRVWKPAVLAAGLDDVRIHDLRHTYASWLIQSGMPLAEVGRLLGHKSPLTTQRYAHLGEQNRSSVVAALPVRAARVSP